MKGYFYVLLITSVCGAVCSILAFGGFEKYIKYIASLICVVIVISPFKQFDIEEVSQKLQSEAEISVSDIDTELNLNSQTLTEKMAKEYISETVFSKFGINPLSVNIKINWMEKEGVIENIDLKLPQEHKDKIGEVKEYLQSLLGGEVNVIAD